LPVNTSQEPQIVQEISKEASNVEVVSAIAAASKPDKVVSDDASATSSTEVKSNTARAEFYQKITQASDEAPTGKFNKIEI